MKKKLLLAVFAVLAFAAAVAAADVNVEIKTDNRVYMNKPLNDPNYGFYYNENDVLLKAQQSNDSMKGYAELEMRNRNFPQVNTPEDSLSYSKLQPWEFRTNEAYVKFFKLFYDGLDVTVGRQIIAWGPADKLNQLSVVCPYDYSDILDFGKKLGANSVRAVAAFGPVSADLVFVPVFTPSLMPDVISVDGMAMSQISNAFFLRTGMNPLTLTYTSSVETAPTEAENSGFAARVGGKFLDFDMHVMYFYGLYNTPVNVVNTNTQLNPAYLPLIIPDGTIDASLTEKYPRVNVIGYDIAGSLFTAGVWGEITAVIPRETLYQDAAVSLQGTIVGSDTKILLAEKPYYKYTVGCDYTFTDGTYTNLQFMHGFFTELGDNLSDLFIGRIEKGFMDDRVKAKIEGGFEFDFNRSKNVTPGALLMPGITYIPYDSTEIELTGLKVFSNNTNDTSYHFVTMFNGLDQIILRAKYSF
jgi:hypothetical protein